MRSGLGIRPELFGSVAEQKPHFGFLEAHSENYFGDSVARAKLIELRNDYPITLHGVGLSIGRADNLDQNHLRQLRQLIDAIDPLIVSEHLAWSAYAHTHVPDLLPLPLTEQSLKTVCEHVQQMQEALGRQVLVENPSNYLVFDQLQIPEPEFLNELAARSGCGLLVDVNNVHVSATNVKRDSIEYIETLNSDFIGQFHLAGYTEVEGDRGGVDELVLIDTHNQPVYPEVWKLYEHTLKTHGARPTLIEWDSDFPEFQVLLDECAKADKYLSMAENKPYNLSASARNRATATETAAYVPTERKLKVASTLGQLESEQSEFMHRLLALEGNHLPEAKSEYSHRFWIYQNNVFAALQDYLEEVFPATRGVVGQEFFKQMAQVYIQTSPPRQGNVLVYGETFYEICGHFEGLNSLPYLVDLIRLEWALHIAYYAEDEPAVDVQSLAQEELLSMPVRLSDNIHMLSSPYPISEIHRQSLPDYDGEVGVEMTGQVEHSMVCRHYYKVVHQVLDDDQLLFITQLQQSDSILAAIESVQDSVPPEILSATLGIVFDLGLLRHKNSEKLRETPPSAAPIAG